MSSSGWKSEWPDFEEAENRAARKKIGSIGVATRRSAFFAIEYGAPGLLSSSDAGVDWREQGVNSILRADEEGAATTVNSKRPRSGQKK